MTLGNRLKELYGRCVIFAKNHVWGIAFALLVGLIMVGPQILFIQKLGPEYKGLYMMGAADEPYYVSRMNRVYQGEDGTKNSFIYESRDEPAAAYDYAELLLAIPSIMLHVSAANMNLIYKFLLPSIAAFLWYALCFRLIKNRLWSICITSVIFLAYAFFIDLSMLRNVLTDFGGTLSDLRYVRPVNPQFSSIFFVGYLHLLLTALRKRTFKYFVWLGIFAGVTFYIYIFLSTFILALNFIILAHSVIKKDFYLAKLFLLPVFLSLMIGSYFIYHALIVTRSPFYAIYAETMRLTKSHQINLSQVAIFTYILYFVHFLLRYRLKKVDATDQFIMLLLVTTFIVVNQQVLTGIELQKGHYHWYFNVPVYIVTIFYVLLSAMRSPNKFSCRIYIFPILVTALSVYWGSHVQISGYEHSFETFRSEQRYMPLFAQLSKLEDKSVIFANDNLSELIPVFTTNYVVWANAAVFFLESPARTRFNQSNLLTSGFDLAKFGNYRLDYLVWDTGADPDWRIDRYHFFKLVSQIDTFKIYKYQRSK